MWFEVRIELCPVLNIELISEYLEEHGALSLTLTDKNDDPILEPPLGETPLWPEVVITALYKEKTLAEKVMHDIETEHPQLKLSMVSVTDQDWVRSCIEDIKPFCFQERLWICPDKDAIPSDATTYLILPPGLAFGTGTHPTTHLCLDWLSKQLLQQKTVLDYGCGSGILALSALKLGAQQAYAVDIDPQALQASRDNAEANGLTEHITIGFPDSVEKPVDLIVANILLTPLLELKERFQQLLKPKGILVLTGLLERQVETICNAYTPSFIPLEAQFQEGWGLVVLQ